MLAKKRSPALKRGRPRTPKGDVPTKESPTKGSKPQKSLREMLGWDKMKRARRGSPFRPPRKP